MAEDPKEPQEKPDLEAGNDYATLPDQTPRKEGGEDSIERDTIIDSRADEKVIINEKRDHKTVNISSQTATNTS